MEILLRKSKDGWIEGALCLGRKSPSGRISNRCFNGAVAVRALSAVFDDGEVWDDDSFENHYEPTTRRALRNLLKDSDEINPEDLDEFNPGSQASNTSPHG